jgi:hypothetical protein
MLTVTTMSRVVLWNKQYSNEDMLEDAEKHLVFLQRRCLCDRWWRSLRIVNDGSQTEEEFKRSVMKEKRRWWRWNFGEEMPQ